MIKACEAKSRKIQILTFITQQKCNSLCNHGLFKHSMFSDPDNIIGNFTTFEA